MKSNPYDNYKSLLDELMSLYKAGALGSTELLRIDKELIQDFGFTDDSESQDRARRKTLERVLLIYSVVLLENMIKDYTRFLTESTELDFNNHSSLTSSPSEPAPTSCIRIVDNIKQDSWDHKVKKILKEIKDEYPQLLERCEKVAKAISFVCQHFKCWQILQLASVIRNIEVHNSGVMNDKVYKYNPICAVGKSPSWDRKLIYNLSSALYMFNDELHNLANCAYRV